jgi:large subunit ribosomal protein L10
MPQADVCNVGPAQVPTKVAVGIKQVPTKVAFGIKALADEENETRDALVGDVFPKAT